VASFCTKAKNLAPVKYKGFSKYLALKAFIYVAAVEELQPSISGHECGTSLVKGAQ
jgi:hypothetical protein